MKCCCLVLLSLWIVLICFKMVKVAQSPISQSGGKNPSRGEGQLKKKCIEFQYGNLLGADFHATTFLQ